uniref:Uncharacterized protein n=1 Tax=Bionectria ochroleuca TaxID=29856 RepID=A0A8H7N9H2_BIOOC
MHHVALPGALPRRVARRPAHGHLGAGAVLRGLRDAAAPGGRHAVRDPRPPGRPPQRAAHAARRVRAARQAGGVRLPGPVPGPERAGRAHGRVEALAGPQAAGAVQRARRQPLAVVDVATLPRLGHVVLARPRRLGAVNIKDEYFHKLPRDDARLEREIKIVLMDTAEDLPTLTCARWEEIDPRGG